MNQPISTDLQKVINSLPEDVIGQKIYKTKIIFLDVNKSEPHYEKDKRFSVRGNNYIVRDGAVSFLPEEAYNALKDAIIVTRKYKTKTEEKDGLNYDDPESRFEEVKNPRYDLTVIDTFSFMVDEGKRVFISENETISTKTAEETAEAIVAVKIKEKEIELRAELEAEYAEKYAKEGKIVPEISDEDIDALEAGEEAE